MAAITGGLDDGYNEFDVEFLRSEATKMYGGINPVRWERIREQDFLQIAEEITGQRCLKNSFVRCPFHGADSTPSFKIYDHDAYCFGCSMYFDAVALVAKHQDCTSFKALLWLENFYDLPPMADVAIEEVVEDEERELKFSEVKQHYIKFASADIQKDKTPALAEQYLKYYFEGKETDSAMPLLAVLGPDKTAEIARG